MSRFLVIRSGAIGDTIFSTIAIDALLKEYGEGAVIDWVATPMAAPLFRFDKRINRVFLLKHKKIPLLLSLSKMRIVYASWIKKYDAVINFEHGAQFVGLMRAVKADKKIAPSEIVESTEVIHEVDIKRKLLEPIVSNNLLKSIAPRLFGTPWSQLKAELKLPENYIVVNPSNSHLLKSRLNYRSWPLQSWKALIGMLAQGGCKVLIIGAKEDSDFLSSLNELSDANITNLIGKTWLPELVGMIEHAQALITTDTGPSHIASATNTPVFTLIGPTDYHSTGPYKTDQNEVHIITENLECSPCYKSAVMKECSDNICMKKITPQRVFEEVEAYL